MKHASWILCLDASAPRTCVALGRVGEAGHELLVGEASEDRANQTSARLHHRLGELLAQAGLEPGELAAVACARGPGTFTGSRVAVATAKGLAIGLAIPVVPLSSLATLAASVGAASVGAASVGAASVEVEGPATVLALLDARREEVYGGVFEIGEEVRARGEERVMKLGDLIEQLRRDAPELVDALLPFGPGCGPYADQLPPELRARAVLAPGPTPAGLWRAAVSGLRAGAAVDAGAFGVSYLRQSYAQMGINKPKRPVFKSPFIGDSER